MKKLLKQFLLASSLSLPAVAAAQTAPVTSMCDNAPRLDALDSCVTAFIASARDTEYKLRGEIDYADFTLGDRQPGAQALRNLQQTLSPARDLMQDACAIVPALAGNYNTLRQGFANRPLNAAPPSPLARQANTLIRHVAACHNGMADYMDMLTAAAQPPQDNPQLRAQLRDDIAAYYKPRF